MTYGLILKSKQFGNVRAFYEYESIQQLEEIARSSMTVYPRYEYILVEIIRHIKRPKKVKVNG